MNWEGIISLLIASIEALLLINLIIFVDKNKVNIFILLLVFLLASYQFFEFLICNQNFNQPLHIYLAFSTITIIPVLNFLMINRILQFHERKFFLSLEIIFILSGLFFIIYYGMNLNLFKVVKCTVYYATYNYPLGFLYGLFYYAPILISFLFLFKSFQKSEDNRFRNQLRILLIGYVFIITPPLTGFGLKFLEMTGLLNSMESILCKFAFFYAISISIFSLITSKFKDERNYLKYLSGYK